MIHREDGGCGRGIGKRTAKAIKTKSVDNEREPPPAPDPAGLGADWGLTAVCLVGFMLLPHGL